MPITPEVRSLIERLMQAAQHGEYPEGDPPVCDEAREFLRQDKESPNELEDACHMLEFVGCVKNEHGQWSVPLTTGESTNVKLARLAPELLSHLERVVAEVEEVHDSPHARSRLTLEVARARDLLRKVHSVSPWVL